MSVRAPNLLASFQGANRQNKTDADILAHILSGEAFHIISGPNAGKYVYREDGISKYTYVGRGRRRTELERANLDTNAFLVDLLNQRVSTESNTPEGEVQSAPNQSLFLQEIIEQNGFFISSGFSSGSYMFEATNAGELILNHITPELSGGQIAGLCKTQARLPAVDFLDALAAGSFRFGQEQSLVYDIAMTKSFGELSKAAPRAPGQ